MLHIICGIQRKQNTTALLRSVRENMAAGREGQIVIVPEQFSFEAEKLLLSGCGNTVSRYAEVVSFSRLADRLNGIYGGIAVETMDDGGRFLAMDLAVRNVASRLKIFATAAHRPEIITLLLKQIEEFQNYRITADMLRAASLRNEGRTAQKLEELALIYESYRSACETGKADPTEKLIRLADLLYEENFAENKSFYIDGFADFTPLQTEILRVLIQKRADLRVYLVLDRAHSEIPAFEPAAASAAKLFRLAAEAHLECDLEFPDEEISYSDFPLCAFSEVSEKSGTSARNAPEMVYASCNNAEEECLFTVSQILDEVSSGKRYRDISVIYPSQGGYFEKMRYLCRENGIPASFNESVCLSEEPTVSGLLAAADAVTGGMDRTDVSAFLNSPLSPVNGQERDALLQYIRLWDIRGTQWESDFTRNPFGYGKGESEPAAKRLAYLNEIRRSFMRPLDTLRKRWKNGSAVSEYTEALVRFLKDIDAEESLKCMISSLQQSDRRRLQLAQILPMLYNALEQCTLVLGSESISTDEFTELLRILLSQYKLKTVPASADAVSFGTADTFRYKVSPVKMTVGCKEGAFPEIPYEQNIFSEAERELLREQDLPIAPGSLEMLFRSYGSMYDVLSGCTEKLYFTCPGEREAELLTSIRRTCGVRVTKAENTVPISNRMQLASYILSGPVCENTERVCEPELSRILDDLRRRAEYIAGRLNEESVAALYGETLKLSASSLNSFEGCAMSFFLRYGLRLDTQLQAEFDDSVFGIFAHYVLEYVFRTLYREGKKTVIEKTEVSRLTEEAIGAYIEKYIPADIRNDPQLDYLLSRNADEVRRILQKAMLELEESEFVPTLFEVAYGSGTGEEPFTVAKEGLTVELSGKIDRIDVYMQENKLYFRIIDYKTGSRKFHYGKVLNGLDLQMLLYFSAVERRFATENGTVAGVLYFPASDGLLSYSERPADGTLDNDKTKALKQSGIVLRDKAVIEAMKPAGRASVFLPVKAESGGEYSGDVATEAEFSMLKTHVSDTVLRAAEEIREGSISQNPVITGGVLNCEMCTYKEICRPSDAPAGSRPIPSINRDDFFKILEERCHG